MVCHTHLPPGPPTPTAGHAQSVPPLNTPPKLFERGEKRNIRPPLPLPRYHRRLTTRSPGHNLPIYASMETVNPVKCTRLCNSFRTTMGKIAEDLSTIRLVAANGHWEKWAASCRDVALNPILVSYRYPIPILNAFARQYRTGAITPSGCQVKYRTVEDAV